VAGDTVVLLQAKYRGFSTPAARAPPSVEMTHLEEGHSYLEEVIRALSMTRTEEAGLILATAGPSTALPAVASLRMTLLFLCQVIFIASIR